MRNELLNKEVLAMYDVRGIQNFIFRTNRIKEIMGASSIVENIISDGLNHIIEENKWNKDLFLVNWNSSDAPDIVSFLDDPGIQMQVMYIGGGNAFVLYRTGALCQQINRALARYVFENTYSLQLAVAVVEKTDDYLNDYTEVKLQMRQVKSEMPDGKPVGAFPFMKIDTMTGFPIVTCQKYNGTEEYLSRESSLKTESYKLHYDEDERRILDNLVTAENEDSNLAVIHIDGNNMGKRIVQIMRSLKNSHDYKEVTAVVRGISRSIDTSFKEIFNKMCVFIDSDLKPSIKQRDSDKLYRKIICAGDDITFICNAKVAIEAVRYFLKEIGEKKMTFIGSDGNSIQAEEPFSACAGIAFFHSHFPFSDAYEVAEACCASAKRMAKDPKRHVKDDIVGNFFDFQICGTISAANLSDYRMKHYSLPNQQDMIIERPYFVSTLSDDDLNERNKDKDVRILIDVLDYFRDSRRIPRSQAKQLREEVSKGSEATDAYITFLKSRSRELPEDETRRFWYDALELMDLYVSAKEAEGVEN